MTGISLRLAVVPLVSANIRTRRSARSARRVAALHFLDVRGDALVGRDRHVPPIVGDGADAGERVVAAEASIGLGAENMQQELGLYGLGIVTGELKQPQLTASRVGNQPAEANE